MRNDIYLQNIFARIRYKIEHNEPLDTFLTFVLVTMSICLVNGYYRTLKMALEKYGNTYFVAYAHLQSYKQFLLKYFYRYLRR